MLELRYPMFDGETIWEGALVTIENGFITSVQACDPALCGQGLLMPGLVEAHAHMGTTAQVRKMLQSGVTTVCDVSAPKELEAAGQLMLIRSAGMAMGIVMNPKGYVEQAAANGAKYIKVLLFHVRSIGKKALQGIVLAAHEKNLKVAVHATEVATVRQAVEAGADILLHVPMKEPFPTELAKEIADKGIAVAPTLVMMQTFARSGQNGYEPVHYQNAERAVRLLKDCGVMLLAGTDANPGSFAPGVGYGDTLHHELELLVHAGLTPMEALTAATGSNARAFGLQAGRITPGCAATMLLVNGRPDRQIEDSRKLSKVWVRGEEVQ